MKTLKYTFLFFFLISKVCNSQIVLENTTTVSLNGSIYQWVYLKHSGYKSLLLHSDTLDVYNLNNSLFKRILLPSVYLSGNYTINYVSEGLFDLDTLHIDYMFCSVYGDSILVNKDNGLQVYKFDSLGLSTGGDPLGQWFNSPIINTDSGTYLYLKKTNTISNIATYEKFLLPGVLPCIPGCTGGNTLTNSEVISNSGYSNVYPNPAVSYTNIYYNLLAGANEGEIILYDLSGREVKQYAITPQFDHLRLTTSDIKAGTYCYRIICDGKSISSKKIVIVK